jgi:acyl-CoA thioester hydrolase
MNPQSDSSNRGYVHEHRLRVRYAETDQMGRAHHASYVVYLEEGRTRMMADLGLSYADVERRGFGLVVRAVGLRYHAASVYEDELIVRTWVHELRGASVDLAYEVVKAADGVRVASGNTQLACVDLRADPPAVRPLPEDLAAMFQGARAGRSPA